MASIVKRKSKYSVVYDYTDENGKRRQRWETFSTNAEAKKRKKQIEYEQDSGTFFIPTAKTLNDLLDEYMSSIINSVVSAKAPERFTNKFLEDLGFKSSNDRLYVGLFKALGLIDDTGQPTARYYEFIDQTQTAHILAVAIEEAYEDLFSLRKDAQNLSSDEVKNKLKTLTQGQKSDTVLGNMASTFKALCALADWNKQPVIQSEESQEVISHVENPVREAPFPTQNKLISDMNLHYNIQIHLPETTNMAVYDAIFQSLKKHLL